MMSNEQEQLRGPYTNSARWRHSHFNHRGSVSARLAIGLVIVALGLVHLADGMGIMSVHQPMRFFWPAVFIAIGVTILIERKSIHSQYWAYGWLGAGFVEFAYQVYWIPFGIGKLIFPLVLLMLGARLIQRSINAPALDGRSDGSPSDGQTRIFALLSGSERRTFTLPMKDAEVISIMSGVKLDLTNAVIDGERATLHVTAIMGGIEIFAPSEWSIVSEVTPILGAYVDKRRPTATPVTKTLFIDGLVLMGGIEVKN
jgi:predicted membrane protein